MTELRRMPASAEGQAAAQTGVVRYQAVCSYVENESEHCYTYGLQCLQDSVGTWIELDIIPDISPRREMVLHLAAQCNALHLSPLHFREVVEDYILS